METQLLTKLLFRKQLGEVIRRQRKARGWTLQQLSEMSVVSQTYLSEIERGEKDVSSEILACICRGLSIELFDLLQQTVDRMRLIREVDQLELTVNRPSPSPEFREYALS
jgi:transcriptional regulator with XRE-family HTH domain